MNLVLAVAEKNINNVMAHKVFKKVLAPVAFLAMGFLSNSLQAQVEVEADSMLKIVTRNRVWSRPDKIAGYRVLLHNGSKAEADKVAADFKALFPDEPLIMKWDEPNYKVIGGMFYSRNDAKAFMQKCSRKFPMMIIINDKIDLPPVTESKEDEKR